jgi:hypothetical protein
MTVLLKPRNFLADWFTGRSVTLYGKFRDLFQLRCAGRKPGRRIQNDLPSLARRGIFGAGPCRLWISGSSVFPGD